MTFLNLSTFKRFVQFGIVGCSGVIVDMGVLFLLVDPKILGLNLSLGKALAAEVALLNNFCWNELWTFRDISVIESHWRARGARLVKFNLICLFGVVLSVVLLNVGVRWLEMNVYICNLIAILVSSFWNFGMNLKFGWNRSVSGINIGIKEPDAASVVAAT